MEAEVILEAIRDYLDAEDWNYDYVADRSLISTGLTLRNRMKNVKIIATAKEGIFTSYYIFPINADHTKLEEIYKLMNFANWHMNSGNFEVDPSDGEMRFRYAVRVGGLETLPLDMIAPAFVIPAMMCEDYGDALATLAFGFSSADEEIQKLIDAQNEKE